MVQSQNEPQKIGVDDYSVPRDRRRLAREINSSPNRLSDDLRAHAHQLVAEFKSLASARGIGELSQHTKGEFALVKMSQGYLKFSPGHQTSRHCDRNLN